MKNRILEGTRNIKMTFEPEGANAELDIELFCNEEGEVEIQSIFENDVDVTDEFDEECVGMIICDLENGFYSGDAIWLEA